jgi:hypothetical protein
MKDNSIQFFTDDQKRSVTNHIENLYRFNRHEGEKDFLKSDEGKKLLKEVNESDFAKELQADREAILKDFDKYTKLYTQLATTLDRETARSILRILRSPSAHVKEDSFRYSGLALTGLAPTHLNHFYSDTVYDAIMDGTNRKDLDCDIGERISNRIERKVTKRITYTTDMWTVEQEICAIVATIPACDLSQAIDKVVEKFPYSRANEYTIKEDECSGETEKGNDPVDGLIEKVSMN